MNDFSILDLSRRGPISQAAILRVAIRSLLGVVGLTLLALFAAVASAADGTWIGGPAATWDATDTNWTGVAAGTPWDITNGPTNTAVFLTAGDAASLTTALYPSAITFTESATLSNGGGGSLNYATDSGAAKTITVASGKTGTINTDITYGGTGTNGNVLLVNGGGTLTLSGSTKLALEDTVAKTAYFNVEGGSTLNVTGRLNTMIINSNNRGSANNYYAGGTSANNTINVSGSGKLLTGNFNIGTTANGGNRVYISAPGTFNTATTLAGNTASFVLYGNSAQLNMQGSNNLVHVSNGAVMQQTSGGGAGVWKVGNQATDSSNSFVVTGYGSVVNRGSGSYLEIGGSGSGSQANPNPGAGGGSGNSAQVLAGGTGIFGRLGIGVGVNGIATTNNYILASGTGGGQPSYLRQNGGSNGHMIIGQTNLATGNYLQVDSGARADMFGTGTGKNIGIGFVAGADNNYILITGVGSTLNAIFGQELTVGGNASVAGGTSNRVDVYDGGSLIMSNIDNVIATMPSPTTGLTFGAAPSTSTAMVLAGASSALNIGNGTSNTSLVKIGAVNGRFGIELVNATSTLNFNNGRLTAGVTGNLVTGLGTVVLNGVGYVSNPTGFINSITSPITGAGSLVKEGAGTLTISYDYTANNNLSTAFSGSTTVSAGTLSLATASALAASSVTVSSGATLSLAQAVQAVVAGLSVAGKVDLDNGRLTIQSGGMTEAVLRAAVIAGRNGGTWNGASGIESSVVAAASGTRAVGYKANSNGSLTVAFSAQGDTNLNGVVDLTDLSSILAAGKYNTGATSNWTQGDFNYDSVVDLTDLSGILATGLYNQGSYLSYTPSNLAGGLNGAPSLAGGLGMGAVPVPEPSTAVLVGIGMALACLGFRNRRGLAASRPS